MTSPNLSRRHALAVLLSAAAVSAHAQTAGDRVVVLTSYPEELSQRYLQAFEKRYPGARVEILWRSSDDALAYLLAGGWRDIDVYWTPSSRNFPRLKAEGMLTRLRFNAKALPPKVAGYAISDPDGYYAAFELAGYGIFYNRAAVERLGLPAPRDWCDLAAPAYRGQVQLPIPGRVGFAPTLIEAVLQAYGWEAGWAALAGIAANADFGAGDRRPGADDVRSGRKAARMTIDFFSMPQAGRQPDEALAFVYPPRTAFNPAHIAISAGAPHPVMAQRFADYVLSREGQELLLDPDVHRLPVRPDVYATHPQLSAHPFSRSALAYDDRLSRARAGLVAALFDEVLVQPHARAVALWQQLHAAEQEGRGSAIARGRARALLEAMPVDAHAQADPLLRQTFAWGDLRPDRTQQAPTVAQQAARAAWRTHIDRQLGEAARVLAVL